MSHESRHSRALQMVVKAANSFRVNDWTLNHIDPDGLRYVATVLVKVHWFFAVLLFVELVYRPYYGVAITFAFVLLYLLMIGFNGYTQYRLRSNGAITWLWILAIGAIDMFNISAAVVIRNGFSDYFFFLFYFPVLAGFAVIFTSFKFNMIVVTIASVVYVAISVSTGDGLDIEASDEEVLLARVSIMYGMVAMVNMVSRFERLRWREAVERERVLQRDRTELSQVIHDTTAQSAYMVGLGIDTAKALAGEANPELVATLDATSQLTRHIIWELRHPINMGGIYQGRELSRVLRSHAASFTNVTSVPAEMTQTGEEPPLSVEDKGLLFSIAHNALANAYRHAEAGRVSIELDFSGDGIRLSVSDDGVGLPGDHAERGQGFASMNRDAGRLGGRLVVERKGHLGGATVTCVMPVAQPG